MAARPGMAERGAWGDAAWRQAPVHTRPLQNATGCLHPAPVHQQSLLQKKMLRERSAVAVLHSR